MHYAGSCAAGTAHDRGRSWLVFSSGLLWLAIGAADGGCGPSRDLGTTRTTSGRADGGGRHENDAGATAASAPPPVALGASAYRAWDRMYRVRIGTRAYMRSTHDRSGGNEGVDASHFLRQEPGYFVALDVAG